MHLLLHLTSPYYVGHFVLWMLKLIIRPVQLRAMAKNAFLAVEPEEVGLDIEGNIIAKLRNDLKGPSIKFTKRHTTHITLGCF